MAERRMFAKSIIDSDAFLDMPITARLLYYDLAMRADDDGFVNSPKKIMRIVGAAQDDLKLLATKKFIIPFENGVVVIKHWRIHNYIRKDTYTETNYKEQKALLTLDENKSYRFVDGTLTDSGRVVDTGKVSIDKYSIDKNININVHSEEVNKLFEDLWKLYVRKEGKNQVTKKAKEEIYKIGYDRMSKAIEKYNAKVSTTDKKYILMGSTFFNGRYADYLENEKKQDEHSGQLKRTLQ